MTALAVPNLSCLKLTRTAIKAGKQKRQLVIGYKAIIPQNRLRRSNKKARLLPRPEAHSPQENIWLLLRKTKEKAARMGGNSEKSLLLAHLYNEARTYFMAKS
jgi:hypothetical protein